MPRTEGRIARLVLLLPAAACVLSLGLLTDCGETLSSPERKAAQTAVELLGSALIQFSMDLGRYPTTQEGLNALVEKPQAEDSSRWGGPYLRQLRQRLPLDPWGSPYVYLCPGIRNPKGFDLFSCGADGKEGGKGKNQDVYFSPSGR